MRSRKDSTMLFAARLSLALPLLVHAADPVAVQSVRYWSLPDSTRVAVEINGTFSFQSDRLIEPPRVFFDLKAGRPQFLKKGQHTFTVDDQRVQRIRVAETTPGVTRVVVDLAEGDWEVATSQNSQPDQLLIEVRPREGGGKPGPVLSTTGVRELPVDPPPAPEPVSSTIYFKRPKWVPPAGYARPIPAAPIVSHSIGAKIAPSYIAATLTPPDAPAGVASREPATVPTDPGRSARAQAVPKPARRNSTGSRSMTRVLGLKLRRVVIDPGHGGHDQGTSGGSGLLEKDVVLDVSRRLGALIEERLESEVVYTRTSDVFIPLEERPRIANSRKADLFLSIHANSSPIRSVTGVETFYLSFAQSKAALDLANRENATSERGIHELRELLQKIAFNDKVDESREFAGIMQGALTSSLYDPSRRDRGVKKAPLVVLIGATMPAVLAEIGFVSNAKEEQSLKKPEYRQKIAEALFRGISRYAESLSHFDVASTKTGGGTE